MTVELGQIRQDGYELWDVFAEQAIRRIGPTQEEEKALREMLKVRYKNDITQFRLEFENSSVKAKSYWNRLQKVNQRPNTR